MWWHHQGAWLLVNLGFWALLPMLILDVGVLAGLLSMKFSENAAEAPNLFFDLLLLLVEDHVLIFLSWRL